MRPYIKSKFKTSAKTGGRTRKTGIPVLQKKKIIYEFQLCQKLQKTILTHFWPMSPFYNPEIKGFLPFSVGIKREYWPQMR